MDKQWFEMMDIIRKEYNKSVWIPIFSQQVLMKNGEIGHDQHQEEYFGAYAVLLPEDKEKEALGYEWSDVMVSHDNRPYADEKGYKNAGVYERYGTDVRGEYLVLQQSFDYGEEPSECHVSQDLVLGLGLWRKGDTWYSPTDNYAEVIRLLRRKDGSPNLIEIKAEYLKDYLCARKSGLLLSHYHSRRENIAEPKNLPFPENYSEEKKQGNMKWSGRCYAIHEGSGMPYGEEMAVLHIARTDIHPEDDVPTYGLPTDGNFKSTKKTVKYKGGKLFFVNGEVWKNDWITPAAISPRVRGDKIESKISFIVDNEGKTMVSGELEGTGRYLWFKPEIGKAILAYPKATLNWYTGDTGSLGLKGRDVHFGINDRGLVTVYAKDIALLPEADKKIWASYNVTPESGVSKELLQSQQEAVPAKTHAPESGLLPVINDMNALAESLWGSPLFVSHPSEEEIRLKVNRFQSTTKSGLLVLAKEMTRYIVERLNHSMLRTLTPKMDPKAGSIKRLEKVLTERHGLKGRELLAPIAGIYELRKDDAHLPSNDYEEALKLCEVVVKDENYINAGKAIIDKVLERIHIMTELLKKRTA